MSNDTIVALATAYGSGAIAIIRLSGSDAIALCNTVFKSVSGKQLSNQSTHTIHLGYIMDNDKPIDQVLASIFKNPNSYTGEDIVEVSCHGSKYIQQQIINLFIKKGARMANPGEFTMRAFLNGKIDLSQAEAVSDLISSENASQHKVAINQMRGGFSTKLQQLRDELINFTALIELELDFSEEDVEFIDRNQFLDLIHRLKTEVSLLITSFKYGNVIKEGIPVAIVGKPNAGKSSLLNALFNENKAIVSDIAGTTRDSIEDTLVLNGITFRFIDTAGLRETTDVIEAQGVKLAKEKAAQAKIILYVFDRNDTTPQEVINDIKDLHTDDITILLLENKIDLHNNKSLEGFKNQIKPILTQYNINTYKQISTIDLKSIDSVKQSLLNIIEQLKINADTIVTNTRHKIALEKTLDNLNIIEEGLSNQISGDLLSIDIREALNNLGEITGAIDIDKDILGTIFGKFCIGK